LIESQEYQLTKNSLPWEFFKKEEVYFAPNEYLTDQLVAE